MKVGVIGGSGLYELEGLQDIQIKELSTPFGTPSDVFVQGTLSGTDVYFLPRHGKGHTILPSEINYKANIHGFKQLGVDRVISVSAVGSLREENRPRDIVLPDQYFDRTKGSLAHTFFGNGIVAHVSFAEPTCPQLRATIAKVAREVISDQDEPLDVRVNEGGTYVNMEGPAFSTKAESHAYRQLGFDIIGMTSLMEAKLCREAELCYQAMAMVTDYDCWRESDEAVSVEMVIGHLMANTTLAKGILARLLPALPEDHTCQCGSALANALITKKDSVPAETLKNMELLVGKYMA